MTTRTMCGPKCRCKKCYEMHGSGPMVTNNMTATTYTPIPSRRYICVACGSKIRRANKPEQRLRAELQLSVMLAEEVADEWVDPDFCEDAPDFMRLRARIEQIKSTLNHTDK